MQVSEQKLGALKPVPPAPIIGQPDVPRIFLFNKERADIVAEVRRRVVRERLMAAASRPEQALEYVINDAAFAETNLFEKEGSQFQRRLLFWRETARYLARAGEMEKEELLSRIAGYYARDIVGSFSPRVYRFVTRVLPILLPLAIAPRLALRSFPHPVELSERLIIQGEVEPFRQLVRRGTVLLVPTHVSNMDSIIIGWALYASGLPPFTYGAGKNLFANPILSFFMHNLGAYKVDRRLSHSLYKDILKTYSTVLLEQGYHSLFFPGGTRSRSGRVETRLKLGLLGTGLQAYINSLRAGRERPNIYVVPCVINYHLVLEASTIIDEHLTKMGKARYIITKDESSRISKVFAFTHKMVNLDGPLHVHFCPALDLFGNIVGPDGQSYDQRGRPIDIHSYVRFRGEIQHVPQRDEEYTRELGDRIVESYMRHNVVLSTYILAFALFEYIAALRQDLDLYRLLRLMPGTAIDYPTLQKYLVVLWEQLQQLHQAGRILIPDRLRAASVETIAAEALNYFGMYHRTPVAIRQGQEVVVQDMKLLFYYHNRLAGYGLEGLFTGKAD